MEPEDLDVRPLSRWPRWLSARNFVIAVVVAGLAVPGAMLPRWAMHRGEQRWLACSNARYDAHERPRDCHQRAWLWLPVHVPWTRRQARQLASKIDYDEAEDALEAAAWRSLDAAAVHRAALALVAAARAEPAPTPVFTTSSRLVVAGAADVLDAHAGELDGIAAADALDDALRRGDAAAIHRLLALVPRAADERFERKLGVVACALGDVGRGRAALLRADAAAAASGTGGDDIVRVALAVCGGGPAPTHELYARRAGLLRALRGDDDGRSAFEKWSVAAVELELHRGERDPRALLAQIAPAGLSTLELGDDALTPWALLDEPSEAAPRAPAWADHAATALVEIAATAKPPRDPGAFDPTASFAAQRAPRAFFEWAALVVDLDASVGWTRRGDLARGQGAAHRALQLAADPDVAHLQPLAAVFAEAALAMAGDWHGRVTELTALLPAAHAPDDVAVIRLQLALALAHDGKLADADAALDPLVAQLAALDGRLRADVQWLRAALRLARGAPVDLALPKPPAKLELDTPPAARIAFWVAAAHATPEQQADLRWLGRDEALPLDVGDVLPAIYSVVGHAGGTKAELWLDMVTGRTIDDPQAVASARAEAARWRGDAAAAARWDARLAAIRALATDDVSAYLMQLALHL